MADKPTILIVEDDPIIAMGLELAVVDCGGEVCGAFPTVAETVIALDGRLLHGAILDGTLWDGSISPVARRLIVTGTPLLIHSAQAVPADLASEFEDIPYLAKPASPLLVVSRLFEISGRVNRR